MLLTLPLTMLLVPRSRDSIKVILLAIIVAGAVTLPAALWNWHKFYFSVVSVQQYAALPLGCAELPDVARLR